MCRERSFNYRHKRIREPGCGRAHSRHLLRTVAVVVAVTSHRSRITLARFLRTHRARAKGQAPKINRERCGSQSATRDSGGRKFFVKLSSSRARRHCRRLDTRFAGQTCDLPDNYLDVAREILCPSYCTTVATVPSPGRYTRTPYTRMWGFLRIQRELCAPSAGVATGVPAVLPVPGPAFLARTRDRLSYATRRSNCSN